MTESLQSSRARADRTDRMRAMIFNADDYGDSREGNAAIHAAIERGTITSVTVLANSPAADEVALIPDRFPHVSVGVHLNLTEGAPALPLNNVPTLVDRDGLFFPSSVLLRKCMLRQVDEDEVFQELTAQVLRVARLIGKPTHVDSHQNVHPYPVIFSAFLRMCRSMRVARVRTQRVFDPTPPGFPRSCRRTALARWAREHFKTSQQRSIGRSGLCGPDRSLFFAPGYDAPASSLPGMLAWWRAAIPLIPEGVTEVVTHPGRGEAERRFYQSSDFAEMLSRSGIRLVSYGDL